MFLRWLFVKSVAVTHMHDKVIKTLQLSSAILAEISSVFRKQTLHVEYISNENNLNLRKMKFTTSSRGQNGGIVTMLVSIFQISFNSSL